MYDPKHSTRFIIAIAFALASIPALLGGCGNSESADSSVTMPTTPESTPRAAAAGPAITDKLGIDQLALESPIKRTKKGDVQYLTFTYAQNDGKVFRCTLPAPMAEGKYTATEWLCRFDAYREPEVVAQKKVKSKTGQGLNDFPFILPKPNEVRSPDSSTERPKPNIQVPTLPPLPASPSTQPGSPSPTPMPGRMPGPAPGPPGPAASRG